MDAAELNGAIAAEKRLLGSSVRRDPGAVSDLLDDDFTEIGQSGIVWTRAAIIAALAAESLEQPVVEASGWTVREVAPDLALVSFQTSRSGARVLRTTLWRRRDGAWRAVAHQATRVVE
jgi:glyoxylase I family protein